MTDAAANNPHHPARHRGVAFWWRVLIGVLLIVLGLLIGGGGAWLIALGGSWYYLPAGIALLLAGILLLAGNMAGVWLYLLTWLATLAWAYWEVGFDGWALMPRTLAPTVILIFVLLAIPAFRDPTSRRSRNAAYVTGLLLPAIALGAFGFLHINALAQSQPAQPPAPAAQPAPVAQPAPAPQTEKAAALDALFEMRPVGDGRSLFASRAIPKGTRLFGEDDWSDEEERRSFSTLSPQQVHELKPALRSIFLRFAYNTAPEAITGAFRP
jgi:hypothetical protein